MLSGCAAQAAQTPTRTALEVPDDLDEHAFVELERAYQRLDPADPQRTKVRARLVRHLLTEAQQAHVTDEYEATVEKLAHITSFYRPDELDKELDPALLPLAEYLRKQGERRGDEARVLSALWIQKHLRPEDPSFAESYAMLRRWSDEARQNLGGLTDRLDGLIEVMAEHARLTPAPEVLATLADLYTDRRRLLIDTFGPQRGKTPGEEPELSYQDYRHATQALNRAPLDIAGVYLVHEDFVRAHERLRSLESVTGLEPRLRGWVERATSGKEDAQIAVLATSQLYLEASEPEIARALCQYGARSFHVNGAFAQCLARLAALSDDPATAAAEYVEATRLSPNQRELYDEALEQLTNLMRGEMFDNDPSETRALANEARGILDERMKRWPGVEPPVAFEDLELATGLAEMSAGNIDEAKRHFEASLGKRETTRALIQMGQLSSRIGELDAAKQYLSRALERATAERGEEGLLRAQILEQLGDVQRAAGELDRARTTYGDALALWDAAGQVAQEPPQRAFMNIRRGVLLTRLERAGEAASSFEAAMQASPDTRETYAQILSHLVVVRPAPEFAEAVMRRAERQLTLDPEWKTYFALWVKAIAGRGKAKSSGDVDQLLARLARSDAWWGHLAQLGIGSIDYSALSGLAKSRGEQAEADFYEGVRRLGTGDVLGARELLKRVLDSRMVGFYEYQMAQELLWLSDDQLLPQSPVPQPTAKVEGSEAASTPN